MPTTWDTIDRYVVISTDTHAGADLLDYRQYLPAHLHDDFDEWAKTYVSPFDDLIIATANRNWDHKLRITEMDADGVAAEVLLPNTVPPFFPTTPNITISLPALATSSRSVGPACRRTTGGRSTSVRWPRSVAAD